MKTLYLDLGMGAAGDMLTAALLELLPDPEAFLEKLNKLGLPGVRFERQPAEKCGIHGTHMLVTVDGQEELSLDHHHDHERHHHHDHDHEYTHDHEHEHDHEHTHEHEHTHDHHHHPHRGLHEIESIIRGMSGVSETVKTNVLAVYSHIAEAESHAHGVPVSEIHFHEVGTMDAIADVTAVCLLMEALAPDEVVASPLHVGSGHVHCAHGILPVPAPATAFLLRGVPIYSDGTQGELCTPTGAALLTRFVTRFGDLPPMTVSAIGYGMGKKDFARANCVRAMLGERADAGATDGAGATDEVAELSCNLDDMTGEAIGFATERLLEAGALDVTTEAIGMKKARPGIRLTVLCRPDDKDAMVRELFAHTSTLGIREQTLRRYVLDRQIETADTVFGAIRRKTATGYGVTRCKWEYDDVAGVARKTGKTLAEIEESINN
ncbi:MAG: nickel pincer cofactor biosynthesis protein LarC [Clostridia bacterium]|nr:nickel pincer cofactor biosynthesis protein LarC [Clostridia bacterium]